MGRVNSDASYSAVPYAFDPYPPSHPGHLAVVATLAGLRPSRVECCRVLELGCARGGNLIPMAASLPASQFVGIELSAGQVAAAREVIEALALPNIVVENRDILDVGPDLGTFDYIVCHGTYSWVGPHVQDKIFEIAARNLAADGIAYISYNTDPGWRLRGLARDLMRYHAERFDEPGDRAAEARRALDFMARHAASLDPVYGSILKAESEYIGQRPDSYVLHDHLELVNEPCYFHEFCDRAAARGLRYLSEVQASLVTLDGFPRTVQDGLRHLARNALELEQFIDFLINRKFRQSVLCHQAQVPAATPRFEDLRGLHVAAARPVSVLPSTVRNEHKLRLAIDHLARSWPVALPFETLAVRAFENHDRATAARALPTDRDLEDLAFDLLSCYNRKLVEFQTYAQPFVLDRSERPLASSLARYQAEIGSVVTNLRHEAGRLNDFSRIVLRHLDGSHDRSALLRILDRSRTPGQVVQPSTVRESREGSEPREHDERLEMEFGAALDGCLLNLARFALLLA